MRVLLLNYEYPPLGGGAGVATAELAHHLGEQGVAVDVVTAGAGPHASPGTPERLDGGVTIHRVRASRKGIHQAGAAGASSYLLNALPIVRRLVGSRRYDVAHVFFSLPTGALLPFARLADTPVVVSLRGSDVPGYDRSKPTLQRAHRVLLPVTRWIWRRADRVVAVCDALAALARNSDPGVQVDVIQNGVDLELFRPPSTPPVRHGETIRCIAVARLIQRKGLGCLLRAWSRLERGRFTLEIAGDGPLEDYLKTLAAELGVEREVRFLGALDRSSLAERLRAANLFTLAPYDEAFGNVFAEALASGLPVVASDVGGIPELVRHGVHGTLVPAGDHEALANAIQRLGDDRPLRAKMATVNRAHAEATLSWAGMTRRYLTLYRELAPAGSIPAAAREPLHQ